MVDADGTHVTVKMDEDFKVTATETGRPGGPGRHGGPRGEELTGETAEKVKAAALEAVPGGTIVRAATGCNGSAYHALARRSDGTAVHVEVDQDFKVTEVEEHTGPGIRGENS